LHLLLKYFYLPRLRGQLQGTKLSEGYSKANRFYKSLAFEKSLREDESQTVWTMQNVKRNKTIYWHGRTGMSTSSSGEESKVSVKWQTRLQYTFCPQTTFHLK